MYNLNVDNRVLNNLRQTMNSLRCCEDGFLSIKQFRELFLSQFKGHSKAMNIYELVLNVIKVDDENVGVSKLSELIDFFNYVPY